MNVFWDNCLDYFKTVLSAQQFKTWVQPLDGSIIDNDIVIIAPNNFLLVWARDNYSKDFRRLGKEVHGTNLSIVFSIKPSTPIEYDKMSVPVNNEPTITSSTIEHRPAKSTRAPQLNPAFTFESFVTGRGNQLARAAAIQVCDNPAVAYNPLFIYGGVGLGKTHLIQAIGNVIASSTPNAKILYIHAEKYVTDVVSAYQHKSFEQFKQFYHSLDLLLIDDIQFFAKKARTQEEFFYLFNALTQSKKQVIMTCDTFPREISGMEDRLVSRFGSGLTVAIEPPELELRVAILLKKADIDNINLSEEVAFFVATHIQSNVRELEGALKRITAYANFTKEQISVHLAKEALKDLLASNSKFITMDSVQKCVADYYKLKVSDMFSKKRTRSIARPRQMAMALSKELTNHSLPDIGDAYGGRDHTTVLHACRKIAELRATDTNTNRDFNALIQILRR